MGAVLSFKVFFFPDPFFFFFFMSMHRLGDIKVLSKLDPWRANALGNGGWFRTFPAISVTIGQWIFSLLGWWPYVYWAFVVRAASASHRIMMMCSVRWTCMFVPCFRGSPFSFVFLFSSYIYDLKPIKSSRKDLNVFPKASDFFFFFTDLKINKWFAPVLVPLLVPWQHAGTVVCFYFTKKLPAVLWFLFYFWVDV